MFNKNPTHTAAVWGSGPQQSVNPCGEVIAGSECSSHLFAYPFLLSIPAYLLMSFWILPLEEIDAILCMWLASEVAVGCGLLVLWFTQCQGVCNGTWTAIILKF